jgi:hypothetical protein
MSDAIVISESAAAQVIINEQGATGIVLSLPGVQGAAGGGAGAGTDLAYDAATRVLSSSTGDDATLPLATTTVPGLQSAADKTKLNGIESGAQVNVPTDLSYTASTRLLGSSTGADVTLPEVTTTVAGLMSGADKTKLNGVEAGAQVNVATNLGYTASTRLLSSSTGADVTLPEATTAVPGLQSAADKTKLDGVQAGAQVNVGTDLSYTASSRLLASSTGADVTLPEATTTVPGLQSAADKTKLNGIETGAQVNVGTNLSYTASTRLLASSTGTDATLPEATTTVPGLQSAADKTKLDGIASGAQVNVGTDLTYDAASREVRSSTGTDATLPLVSTSSAGLVPETGTPSGKYLKDDGTWAEIPSGGAEPAGAAGEIQINDGADPAELAAVPGFAYDTDTDTLNVPGDVNLDDGVAGSTTTYQSVAPTANRTILFPDVTGIPGVIQAPSPVEAYYSLRGGFTGAVPFVQNGALTVSNGMGYDEVTGILSVRGGFTTAGVLTFIPTITGNTTFTGRIINTVNAASNAPAGLFSGNWFTTGTSTTNKAAVLVEQTGAASNGWSPAGTGLGVNSASAFVGRLLDLQKNATSRFSVDHNGMVSYTQDAPVAANTTATLTAANIQNGIVTSDTTAAGVDLTLPTGTDMDTGFVGNYVNQTVHWSVINTGTNAATLLVGADHTIVGAAVVATGTSGRFATRRTAANTWVSYRIS